MDIIIKHPIKAYIEDYSPQELQDLKKQLTYHNTNVSFQIGKIKNMGWLRKKDPEGWQRKIDELQAQLTTTMVFEDEVGIYIRPGSIPYINGNISIISEIKYPELRPLKWSVPPKFTPYNYQTEGVKRLLQIKHGNVDMATGLGKSLILLMNSFLKQ